MQHYHALLKIPAIIVYLHQCTDLFAAWARERGYHKLSSDNSLPGKCTADAVL